MGNLIKGITKLLHAIIGVCLSLMVLFVFSNVILRYFFDTGLTWAEEASRYLFIWLIFLGAIVALKENAHLGVDTLVARLSVKGKKVVFFVNNLLVLITMGLVIDGTWQLTLVTIDQRSAAMDLPLCFVYSSGLIASVSMAAICAGNLYRLISNKLNDSDLVMITGSEDQGFIDQAVSGSAEGEKKQ